MINNNNTIPLLFVFIVVFTIFMCNLKNIDASKTKKNIATWYDAGDLEASLVELRAHSDQFRSLSLSRLGNSSSTNEEKAKWMDIVQNELHINTYTLVGGSTDAFLTKAERETTIEKYIKQARAGGYSGIDLDFEHLPINSSVTDNYSIFLRSLSNELHKAGLLLSACVGNYPTPSNGISVFYDPAVLNETCDVVRVMNYDMYWVGGRGVKTLASRPDCVGVGPTSTQPWAKQGMEWWLARVDANKLVMGLPAYANDYCSLPHYGGGNGTQVYKAGPPTVPDEASPGSVESVWQFFDQIYVHRYIDAKTKQPRIRYGTDARSTQAHLLTANNLGIDQVGFWEWNTADTAMMEAVYKWTTTTYL